jgi:hypothetical protein
MITSSYESPNIHTIVIQLRGERLLDSLFCAIFTVDISFLFSTDQDVSSRKILKVPQSVVNVIYFDVDQ